MRISSSSKPFKVVVAFWKHHHDYPDEFSTKKKTVTNALNIIFCYSRQRNGEEKTTKFSYNSIHVLEYWIQLTRRRESRIYVKLTPCKPTNTNYSRKCGLKFDVWMVSVKRAVMNIHFFTFWFFVRSFFQFKMQTSHQRKETFDKIYSFSLLVVGVQYTIENKQFTMKRQTKSGCPITLGEIWDMITTEETPVFVKAIKIIQINARAPFCTPHVCIHYKYLCIWFMKLVLFENS